ncbi:MAG: DUF92 domain-containing protein [Candidatus Marinimicrobia bacterium]|jgi:uncharacterized protein (TIGR00297 family)|nr:DUF92 domain-containing protein [Candidatus Neomarinimicrobiota bacterium]MBT4372837.1 DUF92 domain-containing protein [Candidatus Neomarinimicrobiota bacterium]MBT7195450.1 DUF92 domain-containing protein [Candidatus Neomarinimicrobiota bacterium]
MTLFDSLNDWTLFLLIFIAIFIVLGLAEFVRNKQGWPPESTRKFVHIFVGLIVSICPFLFKSNIQLISLSSLFIIVNWTLLRSDRFASMHATLRKSYGTVYFPFAILLLSYFWWDKPISFILAILVLAIADPIAAVTGAKGRTIYLPWRDQKSRRGSLAMFGSTFLIIMLGTDLLARAYEATFFIPFPVLIGLSIFTAFSATLAESISFRGSDNLSVPLVTFLTYEIFLINYTHGTLPQLLLWTTISLAIFALAWNRKAVSSSGAISGYLIGILVFGAGGWPWITPLVFFFASSSILSHLHHKQYANRNILQILANGGVGAIFAIIYFFWNFPPAIVLYLGAIGAATADTWATEIGFYSRSKPRLVLSKKIVERGVSGGVTVMGILGSALGAFIIGFLGEEILMMNDLLLPLTIAGLTGSLTDSILGRFIQAQFKCPSCGEQTEDRYHCDQKTELIFGSRWIGNDMVNFINTVVGASVAYFIWMNYG